MISRKDKKLKLKIENFALKCPIDYDCGRSKHIEGSKERYLLGHSTACDMFRFCFRTLAVLIVSDYLMTVEANGVFKASCSVEITFNLCPLISTQFGQILIASTGRG